MKIILLQDVAKIGRKFEQKIVADGFARNSLIPKGKAMIATPGNIKRISALKAVKEKEQEASSENIKRAVDDLQEKAIVIKVKASEKGHLFAGLNARELSSLIKDQAGVSLPEQSIVLDKPIKEVGEHEIKIDYNGGVVILKITIEKKEE